MRDRENAADAVADVEYTRDTLGTLLQTIYDARYSGTVILHCQHGIPRKAEFPARQVTLAPLRPAGGS